MTKLAQTKNQQQFNLKRFSLSNQFCMQLLIAFAVLSLNSNLTYAEGPGSIIFANLALKNNSTDLSQNVKEPIAKVNFTEAGDRHGELPLTKDSIRLATLARDNNGAERIAIDAGINTFKKKLSGGSLSLVIIW